MMRAKNKGPLLMTMMGKGDADEVDDPGEEEEEVKSGVE